MMMMIPVAGASCYCCCWLNFRIIFVLPPLSLSPKILKSMGGNRFSCCKNSAQPPQQQRHRLRPRFPFKRKESATGGSGIAGSGANLASKELKYDETVASLQHISERESSAEAAHYDPSTNPTAGPLFVQRSIIGLKTGGTSQPPPRKSNSTLFEFRPLKKASSCSTIFLDDSTVSHPNLKNMIRCVSMAIYYHIFNRSSEVAMDIFDERVHPLENTPVDKSEPDYRTIYRFIRTLFNAAQLSSECAIITLVYLERLLTYAEIDIIPCTWRRIVLGAILLASKVWDDQAVWNVDYCQILRDSSIDDMNELERRFLELIQFNINVPSSVYAKYYFELRELAEQNDLVFPAERLNEVRALKLEAMSKLCENNLVNLKKNLKWWSSFDNIPFQRRSAAILS